MEQKLENQNPKEIRNLANKYKIKGRKKEYILGDFLLTNNFLPQNVNDNIKNFDQK